MEAESALLTRSGHEVLRLEARNSENALSTAGQIALSVWNPFTGIEVAKAIGDFGPTVAHVHNTWYAMSPAAITALGRASVPTVMTLHNYRLLCNNGMLFRNGRVCEDCVGTHPWRGVQHKCYRQSYVASAFGSANIALNRRLGTWLRHVDLFLALTTFARRKFLEGGIPAERLDVKPNFVLDPGPRPKQVSDSSEVLYVGRVSEEKGIERLVNAWDRCAPEELRLVVVGSGPLREDLARRYKHQVEFVGRVRKVEVQRRMLNARALVFPSLWYEGQPMVLLEALAAGLPVIASEIGGSGDTVGEGGRTVDPYDSRAWSIVLESLQDGSWLREASQAARHRYEQEFSPAQALTNLEMTYEKAVAGRSASD